MRRVWTAPAKEGTPDKAGMSDKAGMPAKAGMPDMAETSARAARAGRVWDCQQEALYLEERFPKGAFAERQSRSRNRLIDLI